MARVSWAISSVYFPSVINRFIFGQGVVIYFIIQLLFKKSSKKPTSFTPKRGDPHSTILFILSTGTGITLLTHSSNIAATTMHFVVKSSFLVCLFVNVTLHNNDEHWRHIRSCYWRQFCALYRVAFNQNRNAVFIRSTDLCFILTVAIYSS